MRITVTMNIVDNDGAPIVGEYREEVTPDISGHPRDNLVEALARLHEMKQEVSEGIDRQGAKWLDPSVSWPAPPPDAIGGGGR